MPEDPPTREPFDHSAEPGARDGAPREPAPDTRVFIVRRRRALALGGVAFAAFVVGIVSGAGHTDSAPAGEGARDVHALSAPPDARHPERAIARAQRREDRGIDRVLSYTPYVSKGSSRKREVALTFDDGPSPYTPAIVRILQRKRAPGTFFIIGRAIDEFGKRYLEPLVKSGFPIGAHTQNHPAMALLSRKEQLKEIETAIKKARRYGIPYPRIFRPPQGSFNDTTLKVLKKLHMLMALWSVETADFRQPGAEAIVERAVEDARPGAIILMHDGGGNRSQTVAALPRIIDKLRAKGYKLVSVPQLLLDDPPPRTQTRPGDIGGGG